LVATGRRPNTDDLGCDAAGVRLDGRGYIVADEHYQTSQPGVFAVGDALDDGPQFTHTSWDDHRLLFDHLMGKPTRPRKERVIPYAVFTDPQVATVGLNETSARRHGVAYELATMPFGEIARALETDTKAGLLKLLVEPRDGRILGATMVGAQVGELVHIFIPLMQTGASPRAIAEAEFVHPTYAEGVQSLVLRLPAYALS
jgi:pyruvate/2-oxoglutarate dehydrogenase complex dihydrolipoamide dehydrogenase (E3) component